MMKGGIATWPRQRARSIRAHRAQCVPCTVHPLSHAALWHTTVRRRSWPLKEGTNAPLWNSARQLVSGDFEMDRLRIEVWHAAKEETLVGVAHVPTSALSPSAGSLTVPLSRPADADDDAELVVMPTPRHASQSVLVIRQLEVSACFITLIACE